MTSPLDPVRVHALLIGINDYRHTASLRGCLRDVARVHAFLRQTVGVGADRIRSLTGADATREAIIEAFLSLADDPRVGDGDQVFIHFSGHGAPMRDPIGRSASGWIESLVAYDSGPGGAPCIPDRTVGALLALITRRTPHVTIVLDCCHSGSGTRTLAPTLARTAEADPRPPPPELDAALIAAGEAAGAASRLKDRGVPYTLLAACRDRELAREHAEVIDGQVVYSGLFSSCLYPTLERAQPGLSHAELMEQVAPRVTAVDRFQHPQCEGRRERIVFGGADVRRDPFLRVVGVTGGALVVDGGTLHGIHRGARLALYAPDARSHAAPSTGAAEVSSASLTACRAVLDGDGSPAERVNARALMVDGAGPAPVGVAFDEDGAPAPAAPVASSGGSHRWRAAAPTDPCALRLVSRPGELVITDPVGRPLIAPLPPRPIERVWEALDAIVRFDRLATLENPDPASNIQGRLSMRVRHHRPRERDPGAMPVIDAAGGEVVLPYDPDRPGELYGVEVINGSAQALHPYLFMLNADRSIAPLYPRSSGDVAIGPGRSLFVGHAAHDELMEAWLPDGGPGEPQWVTARNQLLLIAAPQPAQLGVLSQAPLAVPPPDTVWRSGPLARMIAEFAAGKRMLRRQVVEEWGTARLAVTVMRRPRAVTPGPAPLRLPEGITVWSTGFAGTVTAADLDRHQRFGATPTPPIAALRVAGWLPLRAAGDGAGDAPLVLALDGRGGALRVEVGGTAAVVPMAFDEAGFQPAGSSVGPGAAEIRAPGGPMWVVLVRRG